MFPATDLLDEVNALFPCRSLQAKQLVCFLSPDAPPLPVVVIHGLGATAKSSILEHVLHRVGTPHAIIKSQECITGRHLLERTLAASLDAVDAHSDQKIDRTRHAKCENLSALAVHLQQILHGRSRFVLAFDGVDRQREAPPTLIPALARLHEFIPNLTVVLVVSSPRQRFLHRVGVPYVHFQSYSRDETLQIISRSPLPIFPDANGKTPDGDAVASGENDEWLWTRFCGAVYDSQGKIAARDVVTLRRLAEKLWPAFVAPIIDGSHGARDFSKLMVAKRSLFQSEEMLADRIVVSSAQPTGTQPAAGHATVTAARGHDLPYYSKYLLCAAYLASFNPARTDTVFFMKSSDKKKRRRRTANTNPNAGAAAKHRKIPRRLLSPSTFPLERLLAIFHAILPHDLRPTVDLYTQLASLTTLRLLVMGGGGNILDPSTAKWKVNVGWDYIVTLGRSVGLEVGELVPE